MEIFSRNHAAASGDGARDVLHKIVVHTPISHKQRDGSFSFLRRMILNMAEKVRCERPRQFFLKASILGSIRAQISAEVRS
jgi:hypothetical protein